MGAHDNLNIEGYDLVRLDDEGAENIMTVFNRVTEKYELWAEAPHYSGFTLIHDDRQYEFCREVSYTQAHGRCDQCLALRINGVVCHESGCPRQGEEG